MSFTIWTSVEECEPDGDSHTDVGEPQPIGTFDTEDEARAWLLEAERRMLNEHDNG